MLVRRQAPIHARPLEPAELPPPVPGPGEVLVRVHVCGIEYRAHLFHEKTLTSVEANTRADGEDLLREAAAIPIRPAVTAFPLEAANEALIRLAEDRIDGTGVLVVRGNG